MSAAVIHRYGIDVLRRFAAAIGTAAGLAPARSLALASHLLWFDAAGAPTLGIATFPWWLEAIEQGQVNPLATGRVVSERTTVALFDGENGLSPLILERAADVAVEKAREAAVGIVRVVGVGALLSAAPVAAGIAIGPMAGWVLGPNRSASMALPAQHGLPLVVDSGLAAVETGGKPSSTSSARRRTTDSSKTAPSRRDGPIPFSSLLEGFWLGTEVLVPEDGWLVAAISIPALEPLAAFHERVAAAWRGMSDTPGRLSPQDGESHRRTAQELGVVVAPSAWKSLTHWAHRLAVDVPEPLSVGSR